MLKGATVEIHPGRSLHKILAFLTTADRSYPAIIERLGIVQPMSVTQRKKLNRKLAILKDMGLVFQSERGFFATTAAGDNKAQELGPLLEPGAPTVRLFTQQEAA